MAVKAYKFRIYPNQEQQILINKTIGCSRFVFNFCLAKHKEKESMWDIVNQMIHQGYFQTNEYKSDYFKSSFYEEYLPNLKEHFEFLKEVDSIALQDSIQRLGKAYDRFYKKEGGHPRFKSKKNEIQSYTTKYVNGNIDIIEVEETRLLPLERKKNGKAKKQKQKTISTGKLVKRLKLPKLGLVCFKQSQIPSGAIKTATISRAPSGKYFVSLSSDYSPRLKAGGSIT